MLISEVSTNSSDSPVCKLWVTPTGLPLHLQVSWGNIFSMSEAQVQRYPGETNYIACKRGASRCQPGDNHVQSSLARERFLLALCSRLSEPPTKRQHTHLVYQTPLHSQFSIICQLAEPALCSVVQGTEEDAKQD